MRQHWITEWLRRSGPAAVGAYGAFFAFLAYFCMYAFRKPFAAAPYEGQAFAFGDWAVEQKTALVVSQVLGYALSKFAGVKVCSEASRGRRPWMLAALILAAEGALVLFGALPDDRPWGKVAAIFLNGLPLGMVWGLVVQYLEGRRASDMLLACLACSFIVSSGVVKDVGRALMAGASVPLPSPPGWAWGLSNPLPPVPEYWMPAATGALFLPLFLLSVYMLDRIPPPDSLDVADRVERKPMSRADRGRFLRDYLPGAAAVVLVYMGLTVLRDYRDNYMVDVFQELHYDYEANRSIVSKTELLVAVGTMLVLALMTLAPTNAWGLVAAYAAMTCGVALVGVATLLLDAGRIDGFWWMTLVGLGAYLGYTPVNTVLFDRMIAATHFAGTAVFGMYLADALGYSASVVAQLGKDLLMDHASRLTFLRMACYLLSVSGCVLLPLSCAYVLRRARVVPVEIQEFSRNPVG